MATPFLCLTTDGYQIRQRCCTSRWNLGGAHPHRNRISLPGQGPDRASGQVPRSTDRSATSGTLAATSFHAPHVTKRNPKTDKKRRKPRNNPAWPKSSEQAQQPPSDSHSNTLMNNPG
jgi:hypothetical protein